MSTADFDPTEAVAWLPAEWEEFLRANNERTFRAQQVFRWIQRRGIANPAEMTDLSRTLRSLLETAGLSMPSTVSLVHRSDDGTQKALIDFARGGTVETVLIPPLADDDPNTAESGEDKADEDEPVDTRGANPERPPAKRVTQCISSQVASVLLSLII